MIIRLLPTYIYLFMEAQNAQPMHSNVQKVELLILNNFVSDKQLYRVWEIIMNEGSSTFHKKIFDSVIS